MKNEYEGEVAEQLGEGVVPKPFTAAATSKLVELLKNPPPEEVEFLLQLLSSLLGLVMQPTSRLRFHQLLPKAKPNHHQ